jgi:hypothetical protein
VGEHWGTEVSADENSSPRNGVDAEFEALKQGPLYPQKQTSFVRVGTSAKGPGRVKISRNLGRTVHFSAAELLIRWNRPPIISGATRSFMEALIWSRRGRTHACIASSNPPTPRIIITRFML